MAHVQIRGHQHPGQAAGSEGDGVRCRQFPQLIEQRSADPGIVTVPIMDIRGGDFTNLLNGSGQQVLIYDPLTTQPDGSRTPFSGNVIPANRLNPVAVNALKYYPAPTSTGSR